MSWNRYYSCSDLRMQYHYMFRTCFGDCHLSILHDPHHLSTRIASRSLSSKTKTLENPRQQSIYCYQKTAGNIYYIWHLSLFHTRDAIETQHENLIRLSIKGQSEFWQGHNIRSFQILCFPGTDQCANYDDRSLISGSNQQTCLNII